MKIFHSIEHKNLLFCFRFLYAFHNKDFHTAFRKTLSKYFICCRERRTSTSSSIPLPPATPSGETQRTSLRRKNRGNKKSKIRSKSTPNDRKSSNTNQSIRTNNNGLETSNGTTAGRENSSTSTKPNSYL